jgi:hypothetical protein
MPPGRRAGGGGGGGGGARGRSGGAVVGVRGGGAVRLALRRLQRPPLWLLSPLVLCTSKDGAGQFLCQSLLLLRRYYCYCVRRLRSYLQLAPRRLRVALGVSSKLMLAGPAPTALCGKTRTPRPQTKQRARALGGTNTPSTLRVSGDGMYLRYAHLSLAAL